MPDRTFYGMQIFSEIVLFAALLLFFSPSEVTAQLPVGGAITAKNLQSPFPEVFNLIMGIVMILVLSATVMLSIFTGAYSKFVAAKNQNS